MGFVDKIKKVFSAKEEIEVKNYDKVLETTRELNPTSNLPTDNQELNSKMYEPYELLYQNYLKNMDELREMCNINGLNFEELAKENYVTSNLSYEQFVDDYRYYQDEFDKDIENLKSVISQLISRAQNSNNTSSSIDLTPIIDEINQAESTKNIIDSDSKKETSIYGYKPNSESYYEYDQDLSDAIDSYYNIAGNILNQEKVGNYVSKAVDEFDEMMKYLEGLEDYKSSKSRR